MTTEDRARRCAVVERRATPHGELALRSCGDHYEIISNGVFLMDTRGGESERLLVRAALDMVDRPARILIAGLGVGFSLVAALRHRHARQVTVVEWEPAVIAWHHTHLAASSDEALRDPRVTVVCADFLDWLWQAHDRFDVICVDIDNGPDWRVTDGNAAVYGDDGLTALRRRLNAGGALTVWSAAPSPAFEARLRRHFATVRVLTVEVARGVPDHIYIGQP
jgi:spermidine synthase